MSDEENKELDSLKEKLNKKVAGSGAKFTAIKKVNDGQFQMLVRVDSNESNSDMFKSSDQIRSLIKARKIEGGSLLSKMHNKAEKEALLDRLEIAKIKSDINTINSGKDFANLDIRYRDGLSPAYLDLRGKSADELKAIELYKRSEEEYYKTGIYGTTLDVLSNLASSGFYNDINNPEIKEYFDAWVKDSNFKFIIKKILHNLFKYSISYVLRSNGAYEPHADGVSSIPGKEPNVKTRAGLKASVAYTFNEMVKKMTGQSLDFDKFDELYEKEFAAGGDHPLAYTILDPKYISVNSAGVFDAVTITISAKGLKPIKDTLDLIEKEPTKVSKSVKAAMKNLPSKLREAAKAQKDYVFDDDEISVIYLRKEDFESYAKPRGSRAFDSFDYKDELKKADYATVDGIYNYILKVTVGDKDHPVTDTNTLESFAEAFNTPQKAFTVVWNHTLQIEKITTSEVGAILGKAKYEPVDADITAALGIARALIDGTNLSGDAANLSSKALQSEINAAREQVEKFIYGEYRSIALSAGFPTYPVIKWKEPVITTDSDAVIKATLMQMLDRKAISYQSYMREMNFDYDTEVQRMEEEFPLIQKDILRAGSPYQAQLGLSGPTSPAGDTGRPKGQPTTKKAPVNNTKVVTRKTKVPSAGQASEEKEETPEELVKELFANLENLDPKVKDLLLAQLTNTKELPNNEELEPKGEETETEPE